VDDSYDISDEDTTYNWMQGTSTVTDMYTLENHTTETGTINYVRVFTKAKSYQYTPAGTSYYRMLAYLSGTTTREIKTLTTDYNTFSYLLTTTPGGAAWTWADVDNLKIGWDAKSPPISGMVVTTTIHPSGTGLETECNPIGYVNNWECVKENNESNYVESMSTSRYYDDLYALDNHTTESGVISKINVFFIARKISPSWSGYTKSRVSISGVSSYGAVKSLTTSWQTFSDEWTLNPATAAAWTWANIDALQAGVSLNQGVTMYHAQCYYFYVVVTYLQDIFPKIRTTQIYAVVNYTPTSGVCNLQQPTSYTYTNNRQVNKFNTWVGERKVYDLARTSKTLTMAGIEYGSTATTTLNCVVAMKDNGGYVTISGIGDTLVDTTWLISDFDYNKNRGNPNIWDWTLSLERYENE
jgi:hypothetical protein